MPVLTWTELDCIHLCGVSWWREGASVVKRVTHEHYKVFVHIPCNSRSLHPLHTLHTVTYPKQINTHYNHMTETSSILILPSTVPEATCEPSDLTSTQLTSLSWSNSHCILWVERTALTALFTHLFMGGKLYTTCCFCWSISHILEINEWAGSRGCVDWTSILWVMAAPVKTTLLPLCL